MSATRSFSTRLQSLARRMLKRRNRTQMVAGSTGAHTRRHLFEVLEDRRLLAELGHSVLPVLLPHPDPRVIALEWQGQTAYGTKGEWLVGFEDVQAGNAGVEARLGGAGVAGEWGLSAAVPASGAGAELRSARRLGGTGVFLVEAEEGAGYNQLAAAFSGAGGWKYVEPNFLWSTSATLPGDPRFGELWGLHNTGQTGGTADADIDAPEAWDMFRGSSTVVVASIDTGVDYTHPDLAANMWVNPGEIPGDRLDNDNNGYVDDIYGIDSANNDTDPRDDHGHGTHTSGTMGAVGDNGVGVAGVNWNVQIMALKFLDASGSGSTAAAVTCLDYLTDMKLNHGVNLVASNNSWGGGGFSQALVDAIAASNAAGIMFVASAGNSGSNNDPTPSYPGSYDLPGIISVAATDHNDALAGFSNYGATSVDLGAPGVSILSTIPNSSYGLMSGTSMASPHVAGAVALARAMAPTASLSMIKAWVMDTADDIPALAGKTVSGGRLNLSRMVEAMGLTVIASAPADGAMVSLPPADFVIDFSTPYTPGTAAAGDLLVNGVAATTVTLTDTDTLTFHFNTTPVAAQGPQTMQLSAGSLTRQSDGAPLLAWTVGFRYDLLPLQVTGTLPAEGAAMQLPCTTLQVNFTEEVAPASVDTTDLVLSQGRVTGATRIDADTVQYTLADILREGPLAVSIPAGALTDVFGNPSVSYRGSFDLDVDTVPFPTPLEAKLPWGSLIYDLSAEGVIGVAGDTDRFTIALDAGQRVTVVVQPDAGLRPGVQLTAPGGGTAAASAAAAGQDAVLANFAAAAAGTYTIAVSGAGGTTGTYAVQLILNADVEAEEHGGPANDTPATAQDLGPAMQTLGAGSAQRGAVLGSLPPIIATVYSANMDANPGWTFAGAWAYGVPTGAGGDPLSGFTGNNVIGYNLAGPYANSMPVYYATAPAISTTGYSGLMLSFQRWLGVEDSEFDRATVQVSNNGTTWTTVWDHTGVDFQDTSWSLQTYALPALADNQPTVYLRWAMGPTDSSLTYSGWNLDDVEVYAASLAPPDYYAVDLAAGQSLTVAAASLDRGSVAVELQNAAGTTLAIGKAAGNAEAVINGLVAPASGTYYVRVSGAGNYTLLVTRETVFDTEPNDSVGDAQWLQGASAALGYLTGEPPLAAPPAFAAAGGGSNGYVPGLDSGATGAGANWFGTAGVDYAADRLLVGYHGSGEELAAQAAAVGGRVLAQWPFISVALVEVGGTSLTAAAKALAGEPWVWYVEPDYVVHTLATLPNDPRFGDLWGLHNTGQSGGLIDADVDAPEAWDVVTGARTVVVADIDTGADYTHPDLAANIWVNRGEIRGNGVDDDGNGYVDDIYGIDTAYGDSDPFDGDGHGTHTAGTIGAVGDNGIGVAGVTWDVQIMALKFLDDSGSGSTSGAVEALQYMTRMKTQYGVNLVASNNSWGGGAFSQALQDAIQASNDAGILFVAAAGNEGSNNDAAANYPSNYPLDGIIAVAATDRSDQLASFSNYGLTTVDLGAPGVDIWSTVPGGGYASISGTSMATPHVTGAVALLAAASPGASSEAIKDAILGGADPIAALAGKTVSGARLNLARAVALLGDPGDYYRFAATADDSLLIETYTPGDRPGEFVNVLDPKLELYGSSGALLATNDNAAFDGRNARLTYVVSQTGVYTVRVFSAAEGGEYVVRVTGNTSANPAPAVIATEPADGERLPGFPASYRVVFSEQILLSSLAAGDFAVAGVPALAVSVVDGRTFDFSPDPAAFAEEGTYSVTVAAGAVSDLQGQGNLPFTATFVVDTTPPRIVSSSLSENQLLPEGPLTYQAGLSEPIRGGNLDPSDVVLVGQRTGPYAATSVSYNADTWVVTAAFGYLPEDVYTLRLRSGDGRFEDLVGNDLDGSPGFPLPSGDATRTPDDFAVPFSVDLSSRPANAFVRLAPLGGLMFGSLDYAGLINMADDQDDLTFFMAGGQTVAAVAVPDDPDAALSLALNGGTPVAGAAGQPVVLPPQFVAAGGLQSLEISGDAPTTFTLAIYRNATLEALIGDSDQADPLPLDGAHDSYLPLGEQQGRWAVVGNSTPQNQPGDAFRFLASSGNATLLELQLDPVNQVVIGPMTLSPALDFEPGTGLVYGANDWLRIINPGTGQTVTLVTLNAATGTASSTIGAMGISSPLDIDLAPDGFLYAVTMTTPQTLYRIDPATAAATPLGIYSAGPWGLASQTMASFADPLPAGPAAETPRADTAELDQAYLAMLPAESVGVLVPDVDAYTLDLSGTAGRWIDVVLAGQDGVDFSGQVLELLAPDGAVLATAVADPLGVAADNYDLGILRFPVPDLDSNVYTLRVTSLTVGNYGLLVTDSLAFDSEPNDVVTGPLRSLDGTGAALGYLQPAGLGPNVLPDGGFEAGPHGGIWDEFSTNVGTPICDVASCGTGSGSGPHAGTYWTWFGGIEDFEEGRVAQDVSFPAEHATLSFFLDIPATSGFAADLMEVRIDGQNVFRVTGADAASYPDYTQVFVDVSDFADGGVHHVEFFSQVLGNGLTNFFIDDVALQSGLPLALALPLPLASDAVERAGVALVPADTSAVRQAGLHVVTKEPSDVSPLADAYLPPQYHLAATADLLSPPAPNAKPLDVALGAFRGMIATLGTPGNGHDGKLNVALGNMLTVTYRDADDGTGQPAVVTDTAAVVLFVSLFAADFSDAAGNPFGEGFTLSGPANEWHLSVGRGTAPGHSADDSFYFGGGEGPGGGGSYNNNADGTLTSPLIDLTGYLSPTLTFNHFLQLEAGYDNARVYAVDGSVVTEIWTGSSNTAFETVELDLGAYADKQIRLRFRFTSDSSVTDEGWYVDDVIVRGGVLDPALIGPHVAGIDPPSGPTEDLGITQITVTFSEPVTEASAEDPDSYALVEAGADGVLGTGDDVVIAVVPTPDPAGTVVTLAVAPAFAPLATGQYRLTLDGTSASPLVDLDGNPLNSTTGPSGGRDLVHEFEVFFDFQPGGDIYTVDLAVGDTAVIATATPFADADSQPLNDLDPLIVLFDPAGQPVARDANSLDGKNARLTFTATVAGTYKVQVLAESGAGEYQLSVAIAAPAFTVTGLSPADNSAGVAADTNLAITFTEAIRKGAGSVIIRKSADNSAVATIDVSSPTVTVAGSTVTIDPAGLLAGSTSFYVEVSAGAFEDLAGNDFAGISGPTAWNFNTNLIVTSLTPTSTGFHIRFNRDLAVGVLNLYDQGNVLGLADLTLTGAVVGDVQGSLVIGSDRREATFIKTSTESDITIPGLLQPDRYTVTLKSAATAFCDTSGGLLDGDGNGTPGGDYVGNFTVAAPAANAVTVSLPNVTRGYGQPVNLPADNLTAGLPLTISNGLGVTRVELAVQYDPSLLTISAFALDAAVASRATYVLNTSTSGRAVLTITASTVLANSAGPLIVGSFTAVVPSNAPYAGKHILDIANLRVLDNSSTPAELPVFDDDAIHVAAFFGDANGDGAYNSPDATLTRRIIGLLNTGLAAYQLADPRLIVDISGNGSIQSNDTMAIRRAIGLTSVPNIPALPSGLAAPAAAGADPKIYFPLGLAAAPGETVTEPVRIELTEAAGLTIGGLDLVVEFESGTTPWSPTPTSAGPSAETDVQDRVFDDLEMDMSPLEDALGDLADDIASAWR